MPAAPFGSAAWQLPALVAYLHRLHQDEEDPSPELWRTHTERPTGPVPRPHRRYQGNALHDPDAACVLDIQLGPRETETGWPAADLAVIEQEEGACPFGRITRRHGTEAIAAYAAQELTAEHARICTARFSAFTPLPAVSRANGFSAFWQLRCRNALAGPASHVRSSGPGIAATRPARMPDAARTGASRNGLAPPPRRRSALRTTAGPGAATPGPAPLTNSPT
ncbi:hypothetical protein OHA02_50225 [Streptomyces phaeochromogenes]|nr:hypothetical protein [Streptomyces phaeochromogenes]